jgi:hypothetical protein
MIRLGKDRMGSHSSGNRVFPAPFNIAIASEWMPDWQALAADDNDGDLMVEPDNPSA